MTYHSDEVSVGMCELEGKTVAIIHLHDETLFAGPKTLRYLISMLTLTADRIEEQEKLTSDPSQP